MRLDKWLFYARLYKTRVKSQLACENGDILVNKLKKKNIKFTVSKNDIITIIKNETTIIFKILTLPKNRISKKEVKYVYEIL